MYLLRSWYPGHTVSAQIPIRIPCTFHAYSIQFPYIFHKISTYCIQIPYLFHTCAQTDSTRFPYTFHSMHIPIHTPYTSHQLLKSMLLWYLVSALNFLGILPVGWYATNTYSPGYIQSWYATNTHKTIGNPKKTKNKEDLTDYRPLGGTLVGSRFCSDLWIFSYVFSMF